MATGRGYAAIALEAAASVRAVCPDLPIDLFTDPETAASGLGAEAEAIFDRVTPLPQVWTRSKIDGMAASRFDRSLYLDADIRAVADFRDVFDLLDRFDLALAHDQNRNAEECNVVWRTPLPPAFPQFNSGVVAYRSGPRTQDFFARWAEAVRDHGTGRDQPVLREILWEETDLRVATLPDNYNLMNWPQLKALSGVHAAPRIIHSARFHKHFTVKDRPPPKVSTVDELVGAMIAERSRADRRRPRPRRCAPAGAPRAGSRDAPPRPPADALARGIGNRALRLGPPRDGARGMNPALRDRLRRSRLLQGAVARARGLLAYPELHTQEVGAWRLIPDPSETPRLTLAIPSLARDQAFGGVTTGLEIFAQIGAALRASGAEDPHASGAVDLRILASAPGGEGEPGEANVFAALARRAGLDPAGVEIVAPVRPHAQVPARARELFLGYNWALALNIRALVEAQDARFGGPARPLWQLIQEYEPAFHPMGSDHLLAIQAFNPPRTFNVILNSRELAAHYAAQGNRADLALVLAPRLSGSMRPFLGPALDPARAARPLAGRKRRIVVYGRPAIARNCWSLVAAGLRAWAARHPEQKEWEAVSAGMDHPPLPLGDGRSLRALGKLSLEDYAALLSESAAGLSLMASPHPSYPPLEMAHFGLRTVTNAYPGKDLSQAHDNIVSVRDVRPEALADALAGICAAFEADPAAGARGASHLPDYLAEGPYPCAAEAAAAMEAALRG